MPPQKPKTLAREGLRKPTSKVHSPFKRFGSDSRSADTHFRAKTVPKHNDIDRFGVPRPLSSTTKPVSVSSKPLSGEVLNSGVSQSRAVSTQASRSSHAKLERMLDHALANADAHKQAMHYQAARHFWHRKSFDGKRRWVWLATAALLIVISGFIAWQKVPSLSMKVAGIKTHLKPAVPAYRPDGYAMSGPAKVEAGAVTIDFKSKDFPQQGYAIKESASDMTSTSLAQNVIPRGKAVQTSQVEGNTVYIYGPRNDAVWVNNGMLYKIKNSANLNSDQLIKIVQGLNP